MVPRDIDYIGISAVYLRRHLYAFIPQEINKNPVIPQLNATLMLLVCMYIFPYTHKIHYSTLYTLIYVIRNDNKFKMFFSINTHKICSRFFNIFIALKSTHKQTMELFGL